MAIFKNNKQYGGGVNHITQNFTTVEGMAAFTRKIEFENSDRACLNLNQCQGSIRQIVYTKEEDNQTVFQDDGRLQGWLKLSVHSVACLENDNIKYYELDVCTLWYNDINNELLYGFDQLCQCGRCAVASRLPIAATILNSSSYKESQVSGFLFGMQNINREYFRFYFTEQLDGVPPLSECESNVIYPLTDPITMFINIDIPIRGFHSGLDFTTSEVTAILLDTEKLDDPNDQSIQTTLVSNQWGEYYTGFSKIRNYYYGVTEDNYTSTQYVPDDEGDIPLRTWSTQTYNGSAVSMSADWKDGYYDILGATVYLKPDSIPAQGAEIGLLGSWKDLSSYTPAEVAEALVSVYSGLDSPVVFYGYRTVESDELSVDSYVKANLNVDGGHGIQFNERDKYKIYLYLVVQTEESIKVNAKLESITTQLRLTNDES